ncbi:MAG TPA: tetratricopeptide repeat protein [Bacteroidetes bacterium]|nr:tetratricopeptide repeat protein [Bacteroidota bacterium]
MKKNLVIFLVVCLLRVVATAGEENRLFEKANDAYQAGRFEEAIELYEQVAAPGFRSPELEYNLGNAYYRAGKTGKAILHYERALLLSPGDEDVLYNLRLARQKVQSREHLPDFFLIKWWKTMRMAFSSAAYALIGLLLWWAGFAGLSLWLTGKDPTKRQRSLVAGGLAILISLLPLALSWSRARFENNTRTGIVVSGQASLKSAPDEAGSELLQLYEGEKVQLLSQLGQYYLLRLSNGEKGWATIEEIEKI